MGGMSKRLSSISFSSLTGKLKKKPKNQALVLDCSASSSSTTEEILSQLEQAQQDYVTHITFKDSLQHRDSVRFYSAVSELVHSKHCQLKEVRLIEPKVPAEDYRRWSFKKTNFLRHVYQDCKAKDIRISIHATLFLETPDTKLQDVGPWLKTHFPKTIPQDRDIKSLWIAVRDTRPDGHHRVVSDTVRVFQGMIDVFNNDNRRWDFVHCQVSFDKTLPKYAVPQTEALVEVAEGYDIPLIIKWEPVQEDRKSEGTWIQTSRQAASKASSLQSQQPQTATKKPKVLPSNPPRGGKPLEDTTATTVEYEGSSEALPGIRL